MRTHLCATAFLFLGACEEPPEVSEGETVDAPPPFSDTTPSHPEPSTFAPYVHTQLVGVHSQEVDPADLQPLAEKSISCSGYYAPGEYIDEPRALALGRATRSGNDLLIGGETLVDYGPIVADGVELTHDSSFFYLGVLKRLDLDVVFEWPPEDTAYQLFDPASLTSVRVKGLPLASPSGRYLVSLAVDAMNWVGVEIIERGDAGLKVVKKVETQTFPCGLEWLSDTRATFQELKPTAAKRGAGGQWSDETRNDYGAAYIDLRDGAWVYTPATD